MNEYLLRKRMPAPQKTSRQPLDAEEVWLRIFCAVASCPNSHGYTARRWADEGLECFKERFGNA